MSGEGTEQVRFGYRAGGVLGMKWRSESAEIAVWCKCSL